MSDEGECECEGEDDGEFELYSGGEDVLVVVVAADDVILDDDIRSRSAMRGCTIVGVATG